MVVFVPMDAAASCGLRFVRPSRSGAGKAEPPAPPANLAELVAHQLEVDRARRLGKCCPMNGYYRQFCKDGGRGIERVPTLAERDLEKPRYREVELGTAEQVARLVEGLDEPEKATDAVRALRGMCMAKAEGRRRVYEQGAVPPVIRLLAEGDADQQELAAGVMWLMAVDRDPPDDRREALADAGALEPLIRLTDEGANIYVKEQAAMAIVALCSHGSVQLRVSELGGMAPLDNFGPDYVFGPVRWPRGARVVPYM